MFAYASAFIF